MVSKNGKSIVYGISLIPLAWIGCLYLFAILCRLKLGHFPIPSLDDPKYIGFSPLYFLTMAGMFLAQFAVAAWVLFLPLTIRFKLLTKTNVAVMIAGASAVLIQLIADPFNLIMWLLD